MTKRHNADDYLFQVYQSVSELGDDEHGLSQLRFRIERLSSFDEAELGAGDGGQAVHRVALVAS